MVQTTGQHPELLYPGLAAIYGNEYAQHPVEYKKFFTMETMKQNFDKEQGVTTLPLASEKTEGNTVTYEQLFQGFQQEYVARTYSIGIQITEEMVDDDLYNYIAQAPKYLAQSMRHTEETIATNVLNNAFNNSFTGGDGLELCSRVHPNVGDGITQPNEPSTASDLTQTSLEQAFIDIKNFRDDYNKRLNYSPTKIIVPRSEMWNAQEILKTEYKTNSADNNVNLMSRQGLELVQTNFLTDQDAWFLTTTCPNGLKFKTRRPNKYQADNDFDTGNKKLKTTMRFATGFTDWRGVYGSPGAA